MHQQFAWSEARRLERTQAELAKERKIHAKTRSDMVIKLFSEKISPEIHDRAAKKEGLGVWKEDYIHDRFAKQEARTAQNHSKFLRDSHDEAELRRREEFALERKIHTKTRGDMVVK